MLRRQRAASNPLGLAPSNSAEQVGTHLRDLLVRKLLHDFGHADWFPRRVDGMGGNRLDEVDVAVRLRLQA
jgi:hypothetical protein